eukprot:TRINITY_DN5754_c0_g2_i1.p1 TRINITY_DN5754_c0_g2~~TRINITY_DN5754_c0_g2_i1.p1  ORF type:complete len:319 (+),score=97.51 TRINITY_DN5754_c0_g2_i1:41-958(+)
MSTSTALALSSGSTLALRSSRPASSSSALALATPGAKAALIPAENRADLSVDAIKAAASHGSTLNLKGMESVMAVSGAMTPIEANNNLSLAATNAYADRCMEEARKPSKANVLAVAVRGAGGGGGGTVEKLAVKTAPSDEQLVLSNKPEFEKVWNHYGSSAGSNSCSQPIYFKHRRIEYARLEKMDKDHEAMQEAIAFQAKREAQIIADEAAAEKKRCKRQKKKDAKAQAEEMKKKADGINKFESGNFLEMMMKMDPKVLEEEARKAKEEAAQAAREAAAAKASTVSVAQMSSDQNISIRDHDDF